MDKIAVLQTMSEQLVDDRRSFLMKLADNVNDPSKFDESVPPVEQNQQSEQDEDSPAQQQPGQQETEEDQYAAMPDENYGAQGEMDMGGSPEEVGARAAQAFIGPEVMQMAIQGDPAATELISRTAGQIAGGIATAFMKSQTEQPPMMGQPGMEGDPSMQGGMGAPQPPQINQTTPEEDLAAAIAPIPSQALASAEGGTSDQPATQQ